MCAITDLERETALEAVLQAQRLLRRGSRDDVSTALLLLGVAKQCLTPATRESEGT